MLLFPEHAGSVNDLRILFFPYFALLKQETRHISKIVHIFAAKKAVFSSRLYRDMCSQSV